MTALKNLETLKKFKNSLFFFKKTTKIKKKNPKIMKKKLKFFGFFSRKAPATPQNSSFTDYVQPDHFAPKPQPNLTFKPGGDLNLSEPGNNDSNPESFVRLKGFSVVADDVGSERKYNEIQLSVAVNNRQEMFKEVTKELVNYQPNINLGILLDSDKSKSKDPLVENDNLNKNNEELPNGGDPKNPIIENMDKKRCFESFQDRIHLEIRRMQRNFTYLHRKSKSFIKPVLICYFLSLLGSIYGETHVGLVTTPILAFLLSSVMLELFEEVIKETQYMSLLKELQVFRIDKERKSFVAENMRLDTVDDLNFCHRVCQIGSIFIGLAVYPLILTPLYSFGVVLQCLLIWLYFIVIALLFRFKNNKKVQNYRVRERAQSHENRSNVQSRIALKDLSSSYLRFLSDFERTKAKILEKSIQKGQNYSSKFSSYLTKKTLEVGLQKIKLFMITFTPIIESFMAFFFLMLLLYFNYLLIFAFMHTNLAFLCAMIIIILFISYREGIKMVFERYFLSQKLYKMFRSLISFSMLLPFKLMMFNFAQINQGDTYDVMVGMVILFIVKSAFKVGAFIVLGLFLFKFQVYLHQIEQNQVSHRKNRRKKDKNPESLGNSIFRNSNKESMEEYLDKKSKEFCLSFFIFNFSDLLCSFLVLICSITLHQIPKTRWNSLREDVVQGYLRFVGIDIGIDLIVDFILLLLLRKCNAVFEKREWISEGWRFLRKRGEIYFLGLYFMLFMNFYCFEVFFLLPFKS